MLMFSQWWVMLDFKWDVNSTWPPRWKPVTPLGAFNTLEGTSCYILAGERIILNSNINHSIWKPITVALVKSELVSLAGCCYVILGTLITWTCSIKAYNTFYLQENLVFEGNEEEMLNYTTIKWTKKRSRILCKSTSYSNLFLWQMEL